MRRRKNKNQKSDPPKIFPKIACAHCGARTQLDFDPTEEYSKLLGVVCVSCGRYAYTPPTKYELYANRTA